MERDVKKKKTTKNMNSEGSDLELHMKWTKSDKKTKKHKQQNKSKDRLKKHDLKCLYLTVKGIIVFN